MTLAEFQYAFTNYFPQDQQEYFYYRYVVPERGQVFFQIAFAQLDPHHATRVNFNKNDRAPLLFIAGKKTTWCLLKSLNPTSSITSTPRP
jgi:hypothetical protein